MSCCPAAAWWAVLAVTGHALPLAIGPRVASIQGSSHVLNDAAIRDALRRAQQALRSGEIEPDAQITGGIRQEQDGHGGAELRPDLMGSVYREEGGLQFGWTDDLRSRQASRMLAKTSTRDAPSASAADLHPHGEMGKAPQAAGRGIAEQHVELVEGARHGGADPHSWASSREDRTLARYSAELGGPLSSPPEPLPFLRASQRTTQTLAKDTSSPRETARHGHGESTLLSSAPELQPFLRASERTTRASSKDVSSAGEAAHRRHMESGQLLEEWTRKVPTGVLQRTSTRDPSYSLGDKHVMDALRRAMQSLHSDDNEPHMEISEGAYQEEGHPRYDWPSFPGHLASGRAGKLADRSAQMGPLMSSPEEPAPVFQASKGMAQTSRNRASSTSEEVPCPRRQSGVQFQDADKWIARPHMEVAHSAYHEEESQLYGGADLPSRLASSREGRNANHSVADFPRHLVFGKEGAPADRSALGGPLLFSPEEPAPRVQAFKDMAQTSRSGGSTTSESVLHPHMEGWMPLHDADEWISRPHMEVAENAYQEEGGQLHGGANLPSRLAASREGRPAYRSSEVSPLLSWLPEPAPPLQTSKPVAQASTKNVSITGETALHPDRQSEIPLQVANHTHGQVNADAQGQDFSIEERKHQQEQAEYVAALADHRFRESLQNVGEAIEDEIKKSEGLLSPPQHATADLKPATETEVMEQSGAGGGPQPAQNARFLAQGEPMLVGRRHADVNLRAESHSSARQPATGATLKSLADMVDEAPISSPLPVVSRAPKGKRTLDDMVEQAVGSFEERLQQAEQRRNVVLEGTHSDGQQWQTANLGTPVITTTTQTSMATETRVAQRVESNCKEWPSDAFYACDGGGGAWAQLSNFTTKETCRAICSLRVNDLGSLCCFVHHKAGCWMKPGSRAFRFNHGGGRSVNCEEGASESAAVQIPSSESPGVRASSSIAGEFGQAEGTTTTPASQATTTSQPLPDSGTHAHASVDAIRDIIYGSRKYADSGEALSTRLDSSTTVESTMLDSSTTVVSLTLDGSTAVESTAPESSTAAPSTSPPGSTSKAIQMSEPTTTPAVLVHEAAKSEVGAPVQSVAALGSDAPPAPTQPGCYTWMKEGCPNHHEFPLNTWRQDTWGMANRDSGADASQCEKRKDSYDKWCGKETAQMFFVQPVPEMPRAGGCYVWMPTGCTLQRTFKVASWKRDAWGEKRAKANMNQTVCLEDRRRVFNDWCGTDDARMTWVPPLPPAAGCHVWTPSGCPRQKSDDTTKWKPDKRGSESKSACEEDRKQAMDSWCGVKDTVLVFVEDAPAAPAEPGCYVRTPSGCPQHPKFTASGQSWVRDDWGERSMNASLDRAACEERRRRVFVDWCGSEDVVMLYVRQRPQTPSVPGCYVWMPSGCPKHPSKDDSWRRDTKGEQTVHAGTDRNACEEVRKKTWNTYCGVQDVKMFFLAVLEGAAEFALTGRHSVKVADSARFFPSQLAIDDTNEDPTEDGSTDGFDMPP